MNCAKSLSKNKSDLALNVIELLVIGFHVKCVMDRLGFLLYANRM